MAPPSRPRSFPQPESRDRRTAVAGNGRAGPGRGGRPPDGGPDQLVRGIERQAEGLLGSILLVDPEGKHLQHCAGPSLPPEFTKAVDGTAIGPKEGSCGTAAYLKRMVIAEDIATDPLWHRAKESALRFGLRACWSCPIFDGGDRVLGTFAFYHPVPRGPTEAERTLVEAAGRVARLAILFSGTHDHLRLLGAAFGRLNDLVIITEAWPLDEPGPRIVFVNEAFERVTGYAKAEALGRSPRFLNGPETAGADLMRIHRALHAGRTARTELLNYAKDGTPFWVELEVTPLAGPNGTTSHFVFVEREITQRKQSEKVLREQERAMATLLSNLPGMAFRCRNDAAWTMEFVSNGCLALTGYQPRDLVENRAISYELVIEPEDREPVRATVGRALERGESYEIAYRIRTREGAVKWVWERGQGVGEGPGPANLIEGFITDITERKLLEAQVVQSQRLESIGTLAGGIAHDLNNIFAPIIMAGTSCGAW